MDDKVYSFVYEAMAATLAKDADINHLVGLALKCEELNLHAMELLDAAFPGAILMTTNCI